MFIKGSLAVFTDQKWDPFFNRKEGDEKQAYIMIYPFEIDLIMATCGAGLGLPVNTDSFWLNPSNKEKHSCFPSLSPENRVFK
jgi:hypothetical protein